MIIDWVLLIGILLMFSVPLTGFIILALKWDDWEKEEKEWGGGW